MIQTMNQSAVNLIPHQNQIGKNYSSIVNIFVILMWGYFSDSNSDSSSSDNESSTVNTSHEKSTSKSINEQETSKSELNNTSPEGTDEDTRTGAITSNKNASQYHNDNSDESDHRDEESDAISNQSGNQQYSSSKSSIDVSLNYFFNIFIQKFNRVVFIGRRYCSS